jgi:hypothetical protein
MDWQPIETAPKDAPVLLFGMTNPDERMVRFKKPVVFSGYWESLDEAWCAHGSHWDGPFFQPTHWMPLPAPPTTA